MNHKRMLLFLIPSLIVLFILISLLGINLKVALNPELEIQTTIPQVTYYTLNGDSLSLEFDTTVDSLRACSTQCSFTLSDALSGKILFSQSHPIKSSFKADIPYQVVDSFSSWKYLQYKVACNNIPSSLCSATADPYFETTFISISHNQTIQQQQRENTTKRYLENISSQLVTNKLLFDSSLSNLSQINFSSIEERELISSFDIFSAKMEVQKDQFESFLDTWDQGKYESMNLSELESLFLELNDSHTVITELNIETNNLISEFELYVGELNVLISKEASLKSLENWYVHSNDLFSQNEVASSLDQLYAFVVNYNEKNVTSLSQSILELFTLSSQINSFESVYEQLQFDAITHVSNLTRLFYSEPINSLNDSCQAIDASVISINIHNLENFNTLQNEYSHLASNATVLALLDDYSKAIYVNGSYNSTEYPFENISSYHLNWSIDLLAAKDAYCFNNSIELNLSLVPLVVISNISFTFDLISIEDPLQQCCSYGMCISCSQVKNKYPVIMVHGHAFSKSTSTDASLHAFSKLQNYLENISYFNVGELSDYPLASWSHLPAPISVRVTYYYLSYVDVGQYHLSTKKSESIENYAIRLKEVIDDVKLKTGQDEVVIIAHSMGGLVTRQYLSLFGEQSVNTVIFVGTPNSGVVGNADQFCSFIGANKECEEMKKGSVFLKRLENYVPITTKMYTIAGVGCDMGEYVGDGVVTVDSVALPYAVNTVVNGTCTDSLQTELHSNLLDPQLYPQVASLIKNILLNEIK